MKLRAALRGGALVAAMLAAGALRGAVAAAPNILVVFADDLGIGDVSCYNPRSAWRTPAFDRLAREGLMFTDAHVASSLCTPSRYALLTGRYAWRGRLKHGVLTGYEPPLLEPGRLTLPEFLRTRGYRTAMFGKWHLGLDWARRGPNPEDVDFARPFGGGPVANGFDRFRGIAASLDMPPYVWLENDRATRVPDGRIGDSEPPRLWRAGPIADDFKLEDVEPRLIDATTAFLRERAAAKDGQPFFLYLALTAPHTPLLPTAEFAGRTRADYGDFVAQVDSHLGRVLATLDATGLAANTLVVVSSDNGFAPAAGLAPLAALAHDPSGGYRGYKSDLFDGGHRVPLLARWPVHTPAGTRSAELVGVFDLFATCAELLEARLPDDCAEDSASLLPLLRGERAARPPHEALMHHSAEGRFAIRQGDWKLLLWPGSGGWSSPTPNPSRWLKVPATDLGPLPKFQLYDLAHDPAERRNVAAEHPAIVQRLGRLAREFVLRGRSTPGAAQPVSLAVWPEISWLAEFAP